MQGYVLLLQKKLFTSTRRHCFSQFVNERVNKSDLTFPLVGQIQAIFYYNMFKTKLDKWTSYSPNALDLTFTGPVN